MSPQYESWGFSDELGWAAAWLYDATKEEAYLSAFYVGMQRGENRWWYEGYAVSWDDVNAMAKLKMLQAAPKGYRHYSVLRQSVQEYITKWHDCTARRGWPGQRSPCGLCFLQKWAPLRYASTTALLFTLYTTIFPDDPMADQLDQWALRTLAYVLGENGSGRSYMIGYTSPADPASAGSNVTRNYPRRPHHRASSCPAASPYEPICNVTHQCNELSLIHI